MLRFVDWVKTPSGKKGLIIATAISIVMHIPMFMCIHYNWYNGNC
jgi:hypothetical protein